MKQKINWIQIVFIIGVIALIIGMIDPLEGSVIIAAGSLLIAFSAWMKNDRHKGIFILNSNFLFYSPYYFYY